MMKNLLSFLFLFITIHLASAQNFKFEYSQDSIVLNKNIETLAKKLVQLEYDEELTDDLDNLFRLQIAAKEYQNSFNSLQKLRKHYAGIYGEFHKVIGLAYEMYLWQNLYSIEGKDYEFRRVLDSVYSDVSEITKEDSYSYFNLDAKAAKKGFDEFLEKLESKDSITQQDAVRLCRLQVSYFAQLAIEEEGKNYVEEEKNKKYIIQDSLLIPTRDNAQISAILYRKRSDTVPKPVILMFSIYPSSRSHVEPRMSVAYDYIGISAFTRGKRYSPDEVLSFEKDGQDIYDVIDWISKQPWCNGKVGMYGGSYLGFAQWSSTKNRHPALKTIVPMVAVGPGIDYPMYNNVFMSYMLRWIHFVENNKLTDGDEFYNEERWDALFENWYKSGKAFSKLDSLDQRPNDTFQRWLSHPSYDEYWQNMMPYKQDFSKIDIPVLTFTGYFDSDQQGALHYFKEHYKYNPKANHSLVIGPYDHSGGQGYVSKVIRAYEIDSVADIRQIPMTYQWFDYTLKDSIKPDFLKGKVNYQVMGTNQWKGKSSMSDITNDTLTFYLDNTLQKNNFTLSLEKPSEKGFIKEEFDFLDREESFPFEKIPEKIVDSILDAKGKKVFTSQVFEKEFEVSGSFRATIDLMINKKDLDITMELYELRKDGTYFSLSTYLGRASYAKNRSKRKLLRPSKKESIPIRNASFTSKLIEKGSRLVLVLGVSKNPKWQINYGTGKDVSTESIEDGKVPLQIKWFNSSTIRIPVFREN